jgi:lipopolysaccharide/colanic/teichoic acid biosynthesis glycosyltransferase
LRAAIRPSGSAQPEWPYLIGGLVFSDLACVLLAIGVVTWLRSLPALGGHRPEDDLAFSLLVLPVFSVIFLAQGLYDRQNLLGGTREYAAVVRGCSYGLIAVAFISIGLRRTLSREWLVLSWMLAIVFVGTSRFAIRRLAYSLRRRGRFTVRALVVGANADSVAVARLLEQRGSGVRVVGFLDDYTPTGSAVTAGLTVIGTPSALMPVAKRMGVHEAIVVPQALPWETLEGVLAEVTSSANGVRVHLSAGFYDLLTTGVQLSYRNHIPLLTLNKARLAGFESLFKRSLDCVVAGALGIALLPVVGLTAVRLRLAGARPILERRRVIGRSGQREFGQLSFVSHPVVRSEFIRKLPGLINVLLGDLSLVGPRPVGVDERSATRVPAPVPGLRPGLTGPWRQVKDPAEQALLDLYYVRNYSIWLDLQVLFRRAMVRLPRRPRWRTRAV